MDCIALQAHLSIGFLRQEYWSGLPFLQGIFLTQGCNLHLVHWQADSLPLSHLESPRNSSCAKVCGFPKGKGGTFIRDIFEFSCDLSEEYLERGFQVMGGY